VQLPKWAFVGALLAGVGAIFAAAKGGISGVLPTFKPPVPEPEAEIMKRIKWIGAHPQRFTRGRGERVQAIVMHTSVGSLRSMDNFFNNTDTFTSAHYGISSDGQTIHQYVKDADTAHHAGTLEKVRSTLVRGKLPTNPNAYTIGIEHADDGAPAGARDPGQIRASIELVYQLCVKYKIKPSSITIIPHNQINGGKTCPGSLPVAEIITAVRKRWDA
jgi:N-acetyl-anhydromuramyl-L-alanine amidase AmpD